MFDFFKKKKQPAGETITLTINGMHCSSCSLNIDGELEDAAGVISATTSYAQGKSKIVFDPGKTNLKKITQIIEQLGYTVST